MTSLATYLAGPKMRRRWRSYLGVGVLLGLTVGLGLFAIAGARRTQSSYPRFLRSVHVSTMSVASFGSYDEQADATVASLPEVARSRTYVGFQVYPLVAGRLDASQVFEASGTFDGRYFDQDRFTATEGRLPDRTRADEVAVNELSAARFGYHVGQQLDLATYSTAQFSDPSFLTNPPPPEQRITATIVGIGLFPDEVLQDEGDRSARLLLTPAFSEAAREYATYGFQGLELENGDADVDAVKQELADLYPPGAVEIRTTSVDRFHALQATRPLAIALAVFGAISVLAGIVLVSQSLANLIRQEREERAVLRALGVPPGGILRSALTGPTVAIVAGAIVAVVFAIAASPLMPIGPTRTVEAAKGIDVDLSVLGLGSLVVVLLLFGIATSIAWVQLPHRVAKRQHKPAPASRIVGAAASFGMRPAALSGLRMALEPGDAPSAVSTRAVIAGAAVAITALIGAITFGASLDTLVHEPPLYGWNWDAAVLAGNGYDKMPPDKVRDILDGNEHVAAWSGAYFGSDAIDGQDTPLLGMAIDSSVVPPITQGRAVQRPSEVVLGATTAAQLHKTMGDSVSLAGEGEPHMVTVVGIATLPTIGIVHAAHTSLGVGALVVPELVPGYDRDINGEKMPGLGPSVLFVRYPPGSDPVAELDNLRESTAPLTGFAGLDVVSVQRPAEIASARSIGSVPVLLAIALGVGASVWLGSALGTSVRQRRRELAVLKTLGFTRRQLAATVSWQASTTVGLGLLLGVPVGLVVGRTLWRLFAGQLDVVAKPTAPLVALLGVIVGAVLIANVVAVLAARATRRIDPAVLIRSE